MRATAQWSRRISERFGPQTAHRAVVHLRHYAAEYLVVGQGQPLVLVPGLAGGHELLSPLVQRLARHFQVICFPLRGDHDPMFARQPHTLAELAADVADFQNTLLLERPALAGVSFGSAVALEFALRYPRKTGPLILHGLEPRFRDSLGGRIARLALEKFPLPHDNPFFNQFFRLLFARRESVGPLFDFVIKQCWKTDQGVMVSRLALLADFDVRARLKTVTAPTLVVSGQDDAIVPAAGQRRLAQSIPDSRFKLIPNAGHLCFLTRTNSFVRTITEFLTPLHSPAFA